MESISLIDPKEAVAVVVGAMAILQQLACPMDPFLLGCKILVNPALNLQYHCTPQKQEGRPHGLSFAHGSLDSDACVCCLLIIGWQKLGLVRPGCLCSVSRGVIGISPRRDVHYQASSARETIRRLASFEPIY